MKRLSPAGWVGLLLVVSGLVAPIRSAPAQTEVIPPTDEGRIAKWEDPVLGTVCSGNCPGTLCCPNKH